MMIRLFVVCVTGRPDGFGGARPRLIGRALRRTWRHRARAAPHLAASGARCAAPGGIGRALRRAWRHRACAAPQTRPGPPIRGRPRRGYGIAGVPGADTASQAPQAAPRRLGFSGAEPPWANRGRRRIQRGRAFVAWPLAISSCSGSSPGLPASFSRHPLPCSPWAAQTPRRVWGPAPIPWLPWTSSRSLVQMSSPPRTSAGCP